MGKIAVLVDAGYLLVASAELVAGKSMKRHQIGLRADEAVLCLIETASMAEPGDELLRIYWYDAAVTPETLTEEQNEIARKRSCKLRLGTLNRYGNQKGVDTLMVLDMLALARNKAVSSLLVVSGDDDLRPAIEEVQELGVRVHLLGVKPLTGTQNQAERLQRESDSFSEWGLDEVSQFIGVHESTEQWRMFSGVRTPNPPLPAAGIAAAPVPAGRLDVAHDVPLDDMRASSECDGVAAETEAEIEHALRDAIDHALAEATDQELKHVIDNTVGDFIAVPQNIDRRLLGRFGGNLDRTVADDEKKLMRRAFYEHVLGLVEAEVRIETPQNVEAKR